MVASKGAFYAQKIYSECGIEYPTDIPLDLLVAGRGAILRYNKLSNADGRIVFGTNKAIITINEGIEYEGKKRFTLAHELGHFEMHKNLIPIHGDTDATMEFFQNGHQETEANEFASELLMPKNIFLKECRNKKFSPDLLRYLSDLFLTSITSVAYRYREIGPHPLCLFYSFNNKVKYWKKSESFLGRIKDTNKLPPPLDSVATEYFKNKIIYPKDESKQEISKSTWLELGKWEKDTTFYEYCIITPKYNTVLSIVWED